MLRALGSGAGLEDAVKRALGVALLLAAASLIVKAYLTMHERVARRAEGRPVDRHGDAAGHGASAAHRADRRNRRAWSWG